MSEPLLQHADRVIAELRGLRQAVEQLVATQW
jgi:hypothetical protein